nr:hypothetical protein [Ensifer sp. NM-2]
MDELPADAEMAVDCARISPGDAVPHGADPTELLGIEMDELAWVLAFIARIGSAGSRALSLFKPDRRRTRLTVAGDDTAFGSDLLVQRWRGSRSISATAV